MTLDKLQRVRYSRNISVAEIGENGQERLLSSSVCIIGCGALGSVAAAYLAGAGVGKITVVDFDCVDISNLQRQLTFAESDCGQSKAATLGRRLNEINSEIEVEIIDRLVKADNIFSVIAGHDFVLECSDNPDTKYMVDKACFERATPYCIGGVLAMRGQIMTWTPGHSRFSEFFPSGVGSTYTPCSIGGVVGPVPGVIGPLQALEAIKYLTAAGTLLTDRLLVFDGLYTTFPQITIS